jgi:acetyl-CoA carboxylase biotin carboxylase subunit
MGTYRYRAKGPLQQNTAMFDKILIANRGEIAVRVIRACRDLGISPVAVYSEVDRTSLHVRLSDEAYLLGPAPSTESYLVIGRVIEAAKRCGAGAIHPGYGFLSENPNFAEACAEAGIPFIGPSAESMRMMGNKTTARSVLQNAGVPIVPGTYEALQSSEEAAREAARIGYPVMLKAAAGGGGKGMRLVEDASRIAPDFEAASSEAQNAFGDASVYLEKFIQRPRHIEIQVLADRQGKAIYLGERECSIQRRHQKVVEECPSPLVDEPLRREMGEAALRVVQATNYVNAGTVEFLMDEDKNFYFLEMNTRLQVEHPVTEMVTGLDLVREQIRIASGEPLSLEQSQVQMRGWAIECRIYAEDPDHGFMPSPGVIRALSEPQGPGIRVDSGVYEGCEVSIHYDPLMAKLVAGGSDRQQAIARMKRALEEYRLRGIKSNVGFFVSLLSDPEFVAGRLSTKFIEEFTERGRKQAADPACPDAAAVAAALAYRKKEGVSTARRPGATVSAWRVQGRPGAWKIGGR